MSQGTLKGTSSQTYIVTSIANFVLLLAAVTIPWYGFILESEETTVTVLIWWVHQVFVGEYAQEASTCGEKFCLWWKDNGNDPNLIVLYAFCLILTTVATLLGVAVILAKNSLKDKKRNLLLASLSLETLAMVAFAAGHPSAYAATYPGAKSLPNFITDKFLGSTSYTNFKVPYFGPIGWWFALFSAALMIVMLFVVQSLDDKVDTVTMPTVYSIPEQEMTGIGYD
mgnify:CR=1 FL=1